MVESLGEETTQGTTPEQLPIAGFPGDDVRLELSYSEESAQYASHFELDGKTLRLRQPLDRDDKDLSSIMFQVCESGIEAHVHRKRSLVDLTKEPKFSYNRYLL